MTQYNKAIASVLWAVVIILQRVLHVNLALDEDTVTLIATALTPAIVYMIPNAPKA